MVKEANLKNKIARDTRLSDFWQSVEVATGLTLQTPCILSTYTFVFENCSRGCRTIVSNLIHWSNMSESLRILTREHKTCQHYRQSVNVALVFSVIALNPIHESHRQHRRIRLIPCAESFSLRSVIYIECHSVRYRLASSFFILAHYHRSSFWTKHQDIIQELHSANELRSNFVLEFPRQPVPRRENTSSTGCQFSSRLLSSLWTPAHSATRSDVDPTASEIRARNVNTSSFLTSFGAKEAAGVPPLSGQSKPVTRNGTVDGDPPAPALGRRFPHDRFSARVEGRWKRSNSAAHFEAAATVSGTTSVAETCPFGGPRGRARLNPAYDA